MQNEIDLFEQYEKLPQKLRAILDKFGECGTYDRCNQLLKKVEKLGYTFEYGLDASPYNLKKI